MFIYVSASFTSWSCCSCCFLIKICVITASVFGQEDIFWCPRPLFSNPPDGDGWCHQNTQNKNTWRKEKKMVWWRTEERRRLDVLCHFLNLDFHHPVSSSLEWQTVLCPFLSFSPDRHIHHQQTDACVCQGKWSTVIQNENNPKCYREFPWSVTSLSAPTWAWWWEVSCCV